MPDPNFFTFLIFYFIMLCVCVLERVVMFFPERNRLGEKMRCDLLGLFWLEEVLTTVIWTEGHGAHEREA